MANLPQLTIAEIATMLGGELAALSQSQQTIEQVVIDSRQATGNSLFIALVGEKHDGHTFVSDVIANSGNFAVVNHDFALDLPNLIRVPNTVTALGKLAHHYRQLFNLPIAAITGSNGKTTVKEMLKTVCSYQFGEEAILATSGNLNNHLGVPLTLLQLRDKHKVAIVEMGMNHSGEIDYLTKLARPTVSVVNNVMLAHAGNFNSQLEIAQAKGEIYVNLGAKDMACIDLSNQYSAMWLDSLNGAQVFTYGTESTNCYLHQISAEGALYMTPQGPLAIKLQVLGEHNYYNALTVIALALNLGCSLAAIKAGLEGYRGYSGRLQPKPAFNGALIIDDTYNANPDSVRAALAAIQGLARPFWFVLGDLKELGAQELELHRQIGELAFTSGVAKLLTVGNLAQAAHSIFAGDKIHFASNADIVKYCFSNLPAVATLLVKGSHSMHLSEVVEQLAASYHL